LINKNLTVNIDVRGGVQLICLLIIVLVSTLALLPVVSDIANGGRHNPPLLRNYISTLLVLKKCLLHPSFHFSSFGHHPDYVLD
jgi:hypothetical protein